MRSRPLSPTSLHGGATTNRSPTSVARQPFFHSASQSASATSRKRISRTSDDASP